jgi:hypothetical protein
VAAGPKRAPPDTHAADHGRAGSIDGFVTAGDAVDLVLLAESILRLHDIPCRLGLLRRPTCNNASGRTMDESHRKRPIGQRAQAELKEYLAVSLYLYVCLGAILLYKDALLYAEGIGYTHYGLVIIKALILGKFMLVGHALHIGERYGDKPLIYPILHKSIVFLALLFVLDLIEEMLSGMMHGQSWRVSFSDFAGGTWLQILATCLLFFLILLPYFAYREISRVLGDGGLKRLLFTKDAIRSR